MSLKGFHIVFIAVSILLTLGFAVWATTAPAAQGDAAVISLGYLSAASGVGLLVYGGWFLRKARRLIV